MSGCTDVWACNYDAAAETDDGSCEYLSCLGCTDEEACNYDPDADYNDGSCEYTSVPLPVAPIPMRATTTPKPPWTTARANSRHVLVAPMWRRTITTPRPRLMTKLRIRRCLNPLACIMIRWRNTSMAAANTKLYRCLNQVRVISIRPLPRHPTSCEYRIRYACDGTCIDDADGDGVCDEFEVPVARTPRPTISTPMPPMTTVRARTM